MIKRPGWRLTTAIGASCLLFVGGMGLSRGGNAVAETDTPDLGTATIVVEVDGRSVQDVSAELAGHAGFSFPILQRIPDGLQLLAAQAFLGPIPEADSLDRATHRYSRAELSFGDSEGLKFSVYFFTGDFGAAARTSEPIDLGIPNAVSYTAETRAGGFGYTLKYADGGLAVIVAADGPERSGVESMLQATLR